MSELETIVEKFKDKAIMRTFPGEKSQLCFDNDDGAFHWLETELAQKDAQIKGLVEALKKTLSTLDTANINGLITDTIWVYNHCTLFDFIAMSINDKNTPDELTKRHRLEREVLEAATDLNEEWSDHNSHRLCNAVQALQAHKTAIEGK